MIGVGNSMKVLIIAFVCLWPVLLNTIDGIPGVDPTLSDTRASTASAGAPAAARRAARGRRRRSSPACARASRWPLILMVISEMVASTNGIGFFVLQSQRTFAIPEMWSGILLLGILGYVLNVVFILVERRVLRWHRGPGSAQLMLEIRHLSKSYGDTQAIGDLGSRSASGEFVCVVGPSGCGKTTLLKCMSGLLAPTSGEVVLERQRGRPARPRRWRSSSRSTAARCCRG